ncbi:MAG TPA: VOC family protein [Acidimicrobiales bacterium]|nr:VOC family protein [Acidimicrobiales bacterium]
MPTYELARRTLDPGLFSDNAEKMQRFYVEEVGLPLLERLPHSDTYAEIFFTAPGGKLKIQASTLPMAPAVTGYRELLIARPGVTSVQPFTDPDGLPVQLVPPGDRGVTHFGYVVAVPDVAAQRRFYIDGMGATDVEGALRVGDTQLFVEHAPGAETPTPPMRRGFTYITVIPHDLEAAHAALLAAGGQHSMRTLRLADRCLFSWLRDPNGNWVEIVQYAELSGPLPDVERLDKHWDEVVRWREEAVTF